MEARRSAGHHRWPVVRFPNRAIRESFLDMLRLWNRVEDRPRVDFEPLHDGLHIRLWLWTDDSRFPAVLRLVDSYGGRAQDITG